MGTPEFDAVKSLQGAINDFDNTAIERTDATDAYRDAQTTLARLLRRRRKTKSTTQAGGEQTIDPRWLVTDFVTLGSPLTHAAFLLAKDEKDLTKRQRDREFPTCPPFAEQLEADAVRKAEAAGFVLDDQNPGMIAFPFGTSGSWQLHHAAPFAAVRWTNIHDPAAFVFGGDMVSGPLQKAFGLGILDVDLKVLRGQSLHFSHTHYWTISESDAGHNAAAVTQLRNALDLGGRSRLL